MPSEVQILKESKARFEGVIFNQTADLGTNKSTSCKVIDEATGEVIVQSGEGGGGGEENTYKLLSVTIVPDFGEYPPSAEDPIPLVVPVAVIENDSVVKKIIPFYNITSTETITISTVIAPNVEGGAAIFSPGRLNVTINSGDATKLDDGNVSITGTCNLTLGLPI